MFSISILGILYLAYYGILRTQEGDVTLFYHPRKLNNLRYDLLRFIACFSLIFLPYGLILAFLTGAYFSYLLDYLLPVLIFLGIHYLLPLPIEKYKSNRLVTLSQIFMSGLLATTLLLVFSVFL
ncbi:hypothetical protein SORDD16_00420 [Streptococcus oralis]|uniref:Uncharacterized protein n=1 Tax=Streptococcus oralis TaxID=1303 RepID=A0A139PGA9_STROR|nr:hypothetical protein SORDD16_00420 [Streptococcus oralis]